jgi:hypothetical protein
MEKNNKPACAGRPILVTGSHRSGSTWVGKILSLNKQVKYVSEPFNPGYGLKSFDYWFTYIDKSNESQYLKSIENLLKFKGAYRLNLPAIRYWSNLLWPGSKRQVIKDPIASLSSAWLAERFDMDVVVIFRHPAAFYASLKRMNWRFDFDNFTKQPGLMEDHLSIYKDLILKENKSFVEEASIAWLCIHHVLHKYIQGHSNWIVKRHEDLSLNPVDEFRDIYNKLGLDFSKSVETEIKKSTTGSNESLQKALELKRDSAGIVNQWQSQVTDEELKIIKKITSPIADIYY